MSPVRVVNFHMLRFCNANCTFCFAVFHDVPGQLSHEDAEKLLHRLAEQGTEKLTFVGGEPTLHPHLGPLLALAKGLGMTTCVVSNGARLGRLLDGFAHAIDWVGLSVDSASEDIQHALGRGPRGHVARCVSLAERCRSLGIQLKLNTVVTELNHAEDMSELVQRIAPERWKVFQVLPVESQNGGRVEPLLVSTARFQAFVDRHKHLATEGLGPVVEDNAAIRGSYAMIDPEGRFFSSETGTHEYSQPILEVGVLRALTQVGFEPEKLRERGGIYDWASPR